MSADISDTFVQQLQQMRSDLIAQIRAQRGGEIGRAEAAGDRHDVQSGDWAQFDGERDLAMAIDQRETAELKAIEAALDRIAHGQYGLCADCGIDIPVARLHASPTTMRCLGCQERAERRSGETRPTL
jgi:DnaK suppressor protein